MLIDKKTKLDDKNNYIVVCVIKIGILIRNVIIKQFECIMFANIT